MKRSELGRGKGGGLSRGKGLERGAGLKPDPEKVRAFLRRGQENRRERPRSEPKPRVEFRGPGRAADHPCARCGARAAHRHHWLPQQQLRAYARSERLGGAAHDALLRGLLHEERNYSYLCRDCHSIGGTASRPLTRADVPASALEFAAELGPEWLARLEREYPAEGSRS